MDKKKAKECREILDSIFEDNKDVLDKNQIAVSIG